MKKNHFLILSFSVMFAYWILDALMNVTLYHTSFWSEFFLTSPHVMPFFKIIIACLLFGLTLTPFLIAKKEVEQPSVDKMGVLHQISKLLFSSLSTKVNVLKSLEALEEYFDTQHKKMLDKNSNDENLLTSLDYDEFWDGVDI